MGPQTLPLLFSEDQDSPKVKDLQKNHMNLDTNVISDHTHLGSVSTLQWEVSFTCNDK